jgi:hypothetical protein
LLGLSSKHEALGSNFSTKGKKKKRWGKEGKKVGRREGKKAGGREGRNERERKKEGRRKEGRRKVGRKEKKGRKETTTELWASSGHLIHM